MCAADVASRRRSGEPTFGKHVGRHCAAAATATAAAGLACTPPPCKPPSSQVGPVQGLRRLELVGKGQDPAGERERRRRQRRTSRREVCGWPDGRGQRRRRRPRALHTDAAPLRVGAGQRRCVVRCDGRGGQQQQAGTTAQLLALAARFAARTCPPDVSLPTPTPPSPPTLLQRRSG